MGGRISESTLREIRDRADIVEVVSETVRLARSGASYRGLCPFHREKTPSFFVHPSKQIFHCFGCGEGGSVFDFLMKARGLTFAEAVEDLGERYGVSVLREGGPPASRPQEDLYRILRVAADRFRDLLRSSPGAAAARELIARRGVGAEAEQEFFLGYGGRGRELTDALAAAGVDLARAEAAGLLYARGAGTVERFRGRLLFPIADARGRICGFGARAVGEELPKYLNSPESDVYRKSAVLYGLHQALPAIRKEGRVVVVEGYMDLIGLWQQGIRNVVATCGTSLTESHARTLKRLAGEVILLFDGDIAGKRSAVRAGAPLYGAGVSPLVVFPPKGHDPDDWAREAGGAEIGAKIAGAVPLMEYIERSAARKYDIASIAGRLAYLNLVGKYLHWIGDPAERRLYVQRVARTAGLPEETVFERLRGGKGGAAPAEETGPPRRGHGAVPEEDLVLHLLFRDPGLAAAMARDGVADLLEAEDVRAIVAALAARAAAGETPHLREVLEGGVPAEVRRRAAERLVRGELPPGETGRIYEEVLLGLRIREKRRELARLRAAVGAAPGEAAAGVLFTRMVDVRREIEGLEQKRKNAGAR